VSGIDGALKRGLDLVGAALALLALAPALVVTLARGYLTQRSSVLVPHDVYGLSGERLTLWLFDARLCSSLVLRGAPALVQVLIGQLSLVGPRPTPWSSTEAMPLELSLVGAKPGLTGPWRLSGPEAPIEDQAVRDLTYVRTYSIWEDFRLLFESIRRRRTSGATTDLGRWQRTATIPQASVFRGAPLAGPGALGR
jgi:lipopolysaccharide/colanic/teichoic acid biosynthesis glycosyltransferase